MARFRLIIDFDDDIADHRDINDTLYVETAVSLAVESFKKVGPGIRVETSQLIDNFSSNIDNDTSLVPCEVEEGLLT